MNGIDKVLSPLFHPDVCNIIRYWSRDQEKKKKRRKDSHENHIEGMASNLDISNAFLLYHGEIKNNGWG